MRILAVDSPAGGSLGLDTLADHILAGHTLAVHSLAVVRTEASELVTRSSRPLCRLYETSDLDGLKRTAKPMTHCASEVISRVVCGDVRCQAQRIKLSEESRMSSLLAT